MPAFFSAVGRVTITSRLSRMVAPVVMTTSTKRMIERFSYDLEMKTREQNRDNRRTKIERFDWFIERIQTHVATRLANRTMPSPYWDLLWRENEEAMFWSFHPLADKTNNDYYRNHFSRSYENRSKTINLHHQERKSFILSWHHKISLANLTTLKPRFIRTHHYYGQFALSLGKKSPCIFL